MQNDKMEKHKSRMKVPAGKGLALSLETGQCLRVVNTYGTQVVDTWAFLREDPEELLSMEHTREVLQKIFFEPGDELVTNRYRHILTLLEDTSPGGHDTLIAACSQKMFERAGYNGPHANCADNLVAAIKPFNIRVGITPSPWNLFMQAPVKNSGRIDYLRPRCAPGDHVRLRAEADCIVVFSACPDDVYPTNGGNGQPKDVHLVIANGHQEPPFGEKRV